VANASPFTVQWALFSFKGRVGRQSFVLGILLVVAVQLLCLRQFALTIEDTGPHYAWAFAVLIAFGIFLWAGFALTVKRLHDLNLPGPLALVALFPGIAYIGFLILAFMPSVQMTNEHGAPPFPARRNDD
jgi:uncharacterized membrane protein YhaH (DUF805 family)